MQSNFDGPTGLFIADIDSDGKNDIIGTASNANEIAWWRNNGGSPLQWTKQTIDESFLGAIYAFAEDIDGDSLIDVVGAGWDGNEVAWWKNDGGRPIHWTQQVLDSTFLQAHEVYACDLDNDNDVDILAASAQGHSISWWRNDSGNPINWTKQSISNISYGARSVSVDDINNDGIKDVIGASLQSNDIVWWQNDGNIPINWQRNPVTSTFIASHKVCTYDFDGDLNIDILGTAYTNNQIAWWLNSGDSLLTWTKMVVDGNFPGAVIAYPADLDMDGDIDVVGTAQGSNQIAWWRNDSGATITWTKIPINLNFGGVWPLYLEDLDGDFDIDIVAGGNYVNEIRWWENSLYNMEFDAWPSSGHLPLSVQFSDSSHLSQPITSWKWDFDNDGTFDSFDQNPSWSYNLPVNYSVKLVVNGNNFSDTLIHENCINVFNGESALNFDGESGYASHEAASSLNLIDAFTLEAWILPEGWGENTNFGFGRIFDKQKILLSLIKSHPVYNDSCMMLQISHSNGTNSISMTPDNSVNLNEWQHVAVSYNATISGVSLYINGVEQVISYRTNPSGNVNDNSTNNLVTGNNLGQISTFEGSIDETRVWDIVRTSNEIQNNMNQYLIGNESGLVGYWKMNEGNGDTLTDLSTYNNLGIINNAEWVQGVDFNANSILKENQEILSNQYVLYKNYPNPFNPVTTISYELAQSTLISLKIFDISGRLIKTIFKGKQKAGYHSASWNGNDNREQAVSSGMYFLRLETEGFSKTGKMLLIR